MIGGEFCDLDGMLNEGNMSPAPSSSARAIAAFETTIGKKLWKVRLTTVWFPAVKLGEDPLRQNGIKMSTVALHANAVKLEIGLGELGPGGWVVRAVYVVVMVGVW